MEFLKELDRGWQKIVDFNVGDNVTFDVPYLGNKLNYQGKVVKIDKGYAVIQYSNDGNIITSHISLLDGNGYKRIKGL